MHGGDGNNTPAQAAALRQGAAVGVVLSALVLAGCVYWHRRMRGRPDLAPDLLAGLFPGTAIYEAGRAHVVGLGFQHAGGYRIVVAAQNLRDRPTSLRAHVRVAGTPLPLLAADLPGAAVVLAWTDWPLPEVKSPAQLLWGLSASTTGRGGTRVRFATRTAMTTPSRDAMFSAAQALAGHAHFRGSAGTPRFGFEFANARGEGRPLLIESWRVGRPAGKPVVGEWRLQPLWSPGDSPSDDDAAGRLTEVLSATLGPGVWYHGYLGRQFGPFTGEQMVRVGASAAILPDDLVWSDRQPTPRPAGTVEGLLPDALNPFFRPEPQRHAAGAPGMLRLSRARLGRFPPGGMPVGQIQRALYGGDAQPAVVLTIDPLLVACYSDETDATVILRFDARGLVAEHGLRAGSRLLAITTYYGRSRPPDRDVKPGPGATGRWTGVSPYIAEFLSDDAARIAALKQGIPEEECQRAEALGRECLARSAGTYRNGSPFACHLPPNT
jgi:hypothetical protein